MEAERRQVTVLFTDMVGFTAFSERSGEEAAFTLMRSLSKLMDEAVREQGGVVQGTTGDGIIAVFGVPIALEDAPLRACRAALSILRRLKAAGPDLEAKHGVRPQLRSGLNTGVAVVGRVQEGVESGATVLGDTVNLAARLQTLAEPDSVFLSEATLRSVQGMVETSFAGEHAIKGRSQLQRVYRLDALRRGATRFEAAVSRGLSPFVGREHELEVLERGLNEARSDLCVIDLVAEPGMGKSRLLYEFRQRINKERAFVLSGNCSADGQQTPFLPFIELLRGSFRISVGEAEQSVAQKLEMGLAALGLHSPLNFALLLHLLGLKIADGVLTGLDGVLIGLRTRELLQQLLEARCRLSPVLMIIEDLHWIDSVSEEVLSKIVGTKAKLRLLLITTHRPEYVPPSYERSGVTTLHLGPLAIGHIRRLVQARLGVEGLPEALTQQVTEKAEGSPLFAEEIVSFLTERGMLRADGGKVDFDAAAVAAALPASVQSLLTGRVDRLALNDRALLQTAAVIGRRFDTQLLAAALGEADLDARLEAMQALDLIHLDGNSGEYAFKHTLVRDALYQSLLTEPRTALHGKIAEEIELRSGNRLIEVAETLAYHYSQSDRSNKAFTYHSMAGSKSLNVYSLDEATSHFAAALSLLDQNADCASDDQVADFLDPYLRLLLLGGQINLAIDVAQRYLPRIGRLGVDSRVILIRCHYVFLLFLNRRHQEALVIQRENLPMAERLGDSRSKAYALAHEILVSIDGVPKSLQEFERLKTEALRFASDTTDVHIQMQTMWIISWEELHRGRMNQARDSARELMKLGQLFNDPRSAGLGLWTLTIIAILSDSNAEALEHSDQALATAVTAVDRDVAVGCKACALVLLRHTEDAAKMLEEAYSHLGEGGLFFVSALDGFVGLCRIQQGKIGSGINILEQSIYTNEKEGYRDLADLSRLLICELYLRIIAGNEKLPLGVLLKNLPVLLKVMVTASSRIRASIAQIRENPHFDPAGHHIGRAQMNLGLLYKVKKNRPLAVQHLTEAKRILSQFGRTPILARVEGALSELGQ